MANSYVLEDGPGGGVVIVEPCILSHAEAAEWIALVEGLKRGGRTLAGFFRTHNHGDHFVGAEVLPDYFGVPLWAPPDVPKRFGRWQVIPTPGHSPEHVCLFDGSSLVCGDVLFEGGPAILPPTRRAANEYAQTCAELARLGVEIAMPAHGVLVEEPTAMFEARRAR